VNKRLADNLSGFLIALMFAVAMWAIDALPAGARIAVHWGAAGEPDGWTGKWAGLLFIPVLSTVLWFALSALPQGLWSPGKLRLPVHAQRALFVCVLVVEAVVQTAIAVNALGR
jgi:uncharacterized membrane protein